MDKPNKLLGQNFIKCSWVPTLMTNIAELSSKDTVLEIGPGTGILTKYLLKKAGRVIAVEKDKNLVVQYLRPLEKSYRNLQIIEGDILKKFEEISENHKLKTNNYKLIANIPYYLTSRLLRLLLEEGPNPEFIVLTIQKEVAERICAAPPKMNLLALSIQVFGEPKIIKAVPAECFQPKPAVNSAIIKIDKISKHFFEKHDIGVEQFFKLAKAGFAHKRKTLANSVLLSGKKEEDRKKLPESLGLNEKTRAEELNKEQWADLVKNWG